MNSQTTEPSIAESRERLLYFDIFRGMAILAVIGIHVLGSILPHLWNVTFRWKLIATINTLLQFAVPAFLMLSALLLTRSLLRQYSLPRYATSRLLQTVPPFLIWSGIYLLLPENRQDFTSMELVGRVLIGKASFHLYFLFVLLQLYVLIPLLLPVWRKRPSFLLFLLSTIMLTMAVYWSNRLFFRFQLLASIVLWYLPSVALGMWLGSQAERIPQILKRGAVGAGIVAVFSGAYFVSLSLASLRHIRPDTFHYQVSGWLYFASMGFLLLFVAEYGSARKVRTDWLVALGRNSMPIYIAHPLVLYYMKQLYHAETLKGIVLTILLYTLTTIGVPLFLAWLASKLRLSALLFGRA